MTGNARDPSEGTPGSPPGSEPTADKGRLGETAFIGCMYLAVGVAAVALFLMFGQVIFRMFFM
jgi:hypothetical protein